MKAEKPMPDEEENTCVQEPQTPPWRAALLLVLLLCLAGTAFNL